MRYAQTGIRGISAVGPCPGHWEKADPDDEHFSIDCPVHEAYLVRTKDPLWAATPAEVPLTEREQKAADASKATFDAVAAQAVAGLAAAFAQGGMSLAQVATAVAPGAAAALPSAAPTAPAGKPARARKTAAAKTAA